MNRTPHPGCPAEDTLQELAAGICDPETAEETTEHAAYCAHCGPLLAQYLKEFSDDLPDEDAALLGQLQSSSPRWQKKFIREKLVKPKPFLSNWWPRLAAAGAAAAVIVTGFVLWLGPNDLHKAQKLVAKAYGERRTTEMRLPGVSFAQYQPVSVQRANETKHGFDYDRPSLLEAQTLLAKKLKASGKPDPQWLEVEGRIALLNGTPADVGEAEKAFTEAQAQDLDNPELKIDLATSYFERANYEENADLSPAINFLKAALDNPKISNQDRQTALFDLAIAYQKSKLFSLAIKAWDDYLRLDPSSDWSKEARERLDEAKKAAVQSQSWNQPDIRAPLFFLSHLSDPYTLERLDLYQDQALRSWLPNGVRDPGSTYFQATKKLADLLEQHNLDSWLKEFVGSLRPDDAAAVEALSAAIRANKKGLYELAVERSRAASALFAKRGNTPGELRARFESIYASQRFLEGFDCLSQLALAQAPERYRWLEIQMALEKYACSNFGGDFSAIAQGLENSRGRAEDSHFYSLALRAAVLRASITGQQQQGCHDVWQQVVQGLDLYWQHGSQRPQLLFQFYSVLQDCAGQMKLWHAAEIFQRQLIALVEEANQDDDPDLLIEGFVHAELAVILAAENKEHDADLEQNVADSRWNQVRSERTADTYRLAMRIRMANIQLGRGNAEGALSTLDSARGLLTRTQYQLLSLDFYQALGKTYWKMHRLPDAASAYSRGIMITENSLRSTHPNTKDSFRWVAKMGDMYRGLTRVWLAQGRTEAAWKLWEWYRTRSLLGEADLHGFNPLTNAPWNSIEAEIAKVDLPSTRHLIYASFEDGVEAWVVDTAGIRGHWIPIPQDDLKRLVNDFAERCANQSSLLSEVHAQARDLYALLVQPVASDLPASSTVVAEMDKALSRLVLLALISPDGRYFAETYMVIYSSGVLFEKSLRPTLPIVASDRLLLLDASQGAGVPGHLQESDAVRQAYSHVTLVRGTQTSAAEIRRELSRSTVFDFIGHGEQHQSHTELRVNSRVSLTAEDFPPQSLAHIKLTVLAACSTGAGGEDRLLDSDNLVHSFLSAGVPDVIASQWNVDSAATAQLMQSFHARLASGEAIPQAMYQAQKEMLLARNHPYFWAGFNLSGRAN